MKKYYIGQLKSLSDSSVLSSSFLEESNYGYFLNQGWVQILKNAGYNETNINKFRSFLNTQRILKYDGESYKEQYDILTKLTCLELTFNNPNMDNIVFEIIESKDGSMYAKEINTGYLFPIKNHNLCVTSMSIENGDLKVSVGIDVPEMHSIETLVTVYYPASNKDVEDFLSKYKTYPDYRRNIKKAYNENSFSRNVEIIEKENISLNDELIVCNRILNNLDILKNINEEKYNKYKDRYDKLVKKYENNNSMNVTDINALLELEGIIKSEIIFYKENNNFSFIDSEIEKLKKYINKNNIKDHMNICELNDMFNLFLKYQNIFSLEEQNILLDKFACLYFYTIKIDNDYVSEINPYIIERIILYSKELYDNNEIDNYIKGLDTFSEDMKNINFVSNMVNEERKEKNIFLKLFKR